MSESETVGFSPDEIRTGEPTRAARLKWVIVVDDQLPAGRAANAAACVAAATSRGVHGLLGPEAVDAAGASHPGLPWAGCTVLAANAAELGRIRRKAASRPAVHVADMPVDAQLTRVYDEYLERMTTQEAESIGYAAVSLVGPRAQVDRLVGGLPLLS